MTVVPFASPEDFSASGPLVAAHLRAGGVIAYPTETTYGFGSLLREGALERLAALKGGRAEKAFILLIRAQSELPQLEWTARACQLADRFWPGPLTLALRARSEGLPERVRIGGAVAVRRSPHPAVAALLDALGEPITSTSANQPGNRPARSAEEVLLALRKAGAEDVLVLDGGRLPDSLPSTLVECLDNTAVVRRRGAIPIRALRSVVPDLQT